MSKRRRTRATGPGERREPAERSATAARVTDRGADDGGGSAGRHRSTRRRVTTWLWGVLGLAAAGEAVWVTIAFLRPRKRESQQGSIVVAGPAEEFDRGSVAAFPAGGFYLVRLDDGGFLALHRECPHLGCTVPWSSQKGRFPCPCHASAFDITGQVLSPPASRPLDLLQVRIENGIVKIDTRRRIRRREFHPSQVVRV